MSFRRKDLFKDPSAPKRLSSVHNEEEEQRKTILLSSLSVTPTEKSLKKLGGYVRDDLTDDSMDALHGDSIDDAMVINQSLLRHSDQWNFRNKTTDIKERHRDWFKSRACGSFKRGVTLLQSEKNLLPRKGSGITDFEAHREAIRAERARVIKEEMLEAEKKAQTEAARKTAYTAAENNLRDALYRMDYAAMPALADAMLLQDPQHALAWTCKALAHEVAADEQEARLLAGEDDTDGGAMERQAAVEAYRKVLKLRPTAHGAKMNLALLLLRAGQKDEGITLMRQVALGPHARQVHGYGAFHDLVEALAQTGSPQEARKVYADRTKPGLASNEERAQDPRMAHRSFDLLAWNGNMEDRAGALRAQLRASAEELLDDLARPREVPVYVTSPKDDPFNF